MCKPKAKRKTVCFLIIFVCSKFEMSVMKGQFAFIPAWDTFFNQSYKNHNTVIMYPLLGDKVLDEVENITTVDPYEDHDWILPLATILYVIGAFCCILMIIVVIIQEHGGNSGFHRTLTNQMMSSLITTVRSFNCKKIL